MTTIMNFFGYFAIAFCVILSCSGTSAQVEPVTKATIITMNNGTSEKPLTTTQEPPTTTQEPPTTTQEPPKTTQEPPKTTQEPPKTTQEPPKTTQEPPKTTQEPPKTTQEPPTTTQEPPTTTQEPSTAIPSVGYKYLVFNQTDKSICLKTQIYVTLNINFTDGNGTTHIGAYVLPEGTVDNSSSVCTELFQILFLTYGNGNKFSLNFTKDGDNFDLTEVMFHSTNLSLLFPEAESKEYDGNWNGKYLSSPTTFSYLCKAGIKTEDIDGNFVSFNYIQAEAFGRKNDTGFLTEQECEADRSDVSDIVPIAVGCALAGLVVIVLIAYLVGRRQKRQRGYESV